VPFGVVGDVVEAVAKAHRLEYAAAEQIPELRLTWGEAEVFLIPVERGYAHQHEGEELRDLRIQIDTDPVGLQHLELVGRDPYPPAEDRPVAHHVRRCRVAP
jgi:hypothetical protein